MWNLEYGDRDWELEARDKRGLPVPEWTLKRPAVPREDYWFWIAYNELDTCRQWDEGLPKQIPWTAIMQYARYHKVDFDYLHAVVTKIDGAYLTYSIDKHNKKIDEIKREGRSKRRG